MIVFASVLHFVKICQVLTILHLFIWVSLILGHGVVIVVVVVVVVVLLLLQSVVVVVSERDVRQRMSGGSTERSHNLSQRRPRSRERSWERCTYNGMTYFFVTRTVNWDPQCNHVILWISF